MFIKYKSKNSGISLIEVVVYVAILAVISVLVVNTILIMFSAFAKAKALRRVILDGETALERITRETRLASSVDDTLSSLGVDPSHLVLNTVRSSTNSTPVNKEIYISEGRIVLKEGTDPAEFLTSPSTTVSSFVVSKIDTTNSQAIKINLTIGIGTSSGQLSRSLYNTTILRGTY